ncbi:MAG: ATP-binding cassette domain-containing protein [Gammaproteobacteria bacterium]
MKQTTPATPGTEIEVVDLHKAFGDKRVLRGIDLRITAGETIAIVGGSGCGKTVLLNHILGQLRPDRGYVAVVDHADPRAPLCRLDAIGELALERIHHHWGVVFQRNALFSGSVYDNIALWLKETRRLDDATIRPLAQRVLELVDLRSDDAFLATDQHELSGGMAKRLAVARALAMEPVVLFYDEPTTGLDPTTSANMHELIHATHNALLPAGGQRTTVIITHDKDLLTRLRPRTVMLHEGRVFFDGPFAAFAASDSAIVRPYFDLMPLLHGSS